MGHGKQKNCFCSFQQATFRPVASFTLDAICSFLTITSPVTSPSLHVTHRTKPPPLELHQASTLSTGQLPNSQLVPSYQRPPSYLQHLKWRNTAMGKPLNTAQETRKTYSSTPLPSQTNQYLDTPHRSKPTMARQRVRHTPRSMALDFRRQE